MGAGCVAAWDAVPYNPYTGDPGSGCLRRVDDDKRIPRDWIPTGQVHEDGKFYSAAWRLRAALGAEVTDSLVIKSITFLPPDADFLDAEDGLESADVALYAGAHAAAIDAWADDGGNCREPARRRARKASPPTEAFSCDSNPYEDFQYVECRHTIPGATRLRVHFSSLDTEECCDLVRISGAGFRLVQTLSGAPFGPSVEGFSAAVRGDTIVVRFKADSSITANGFAIDQIELHDLTEQCAAGERR